MVLDASLNCIMWNKAMESILGVPREAIVGTNVRHGGHNLAILHLPLEEALAGEVVNREDYRFVRPGTPDTIDERVVQARCSPLRDRHGAIIGVVATLVDMTDRKSLEHEAHESEATLRHVIDAMGDALLISDLQGKILEVNREFSSITGYSRFETIGIEFPYPWLADEEMATYVTWIAELREKHYLHDFDMTWHRIDGSEVAISLNTTLLLNEKGEPMAMLNLARDISDRKLMGDELEGKNKQIEMLNRIISTANMTVDLGKIFDTIAAEVQSLLRNDELNIGIFSEDRKSMSLLACVVPGQKGFFPGEPVLLEQTVSQLVLGTGRAVNVRDIEHHPGLGRKVRSFQQGLRSQVSVPIYLHEKILGTLNIASTQEGAYTDSDMALLQPIADQVGAMIDRAQLFQRVSDDRDYIHNLLNSIDSVVYTVDRSYHIREVNRAWEDFAQTQGLEQFKEESAVVGRDLHDIITSPDLWQDLLKVMPRLFDGTTGFFSREIEIEYRGAVRTYQLVVNPMVINDQVTGLVFTNTDVTDIKKTEAEVKRRNNELFALNTISSSVIRSLELDEVLGVALKEVKEITEADAVLCYLRNRRAPKLLLSRYVGVSDAVAANIQTLEVNPSRDRHSERERRPLVINRGLESDERVTPSARKVYDQLHTRSLVAIPLQSKDRVLGALVVAFRAEHPFPDQELDFLMLIGHQLGAVIDNAQLYAEVQSQVQRVTSLYELGKGLTGALDTKTLLEVVHGEIAKSLPYDRFVYDSFVEGRGTTRRVFKSGVDGISSSVSMESPVDEEEVLQRVILHRAVFIGNTAANESAIAVPVRSKEKIIGVLSIFSSVPDVYNQNHLRLVESIANLTAIALDRAMLYEDTVAKSFEIYERNKELDDFAYVVSHDLKEPLITIEGYSKIILSDFKDSTQDEARQYLASVVQSSARMKNLIDDLLTLSRLGRAGEKPETVAVTEVIAGLMHDFEFTLREKSASINFPDDLPLVQYNPTQLTMVFRNLISNALKFNTTPEPRVDIGVTASNNAYVFSVRDNGIGIAKEHFDRIFVIFQRLHRSEEYQGTGAGLTIVKKIVENHHGRIWVESIPGEGATFYFTIPK